MDLIFVTPVQELLPGAFGAASYGMTGCWDPAAPNTQRFARDVRGTALTGSYADILAQLPASAPQAAIVLFGNAGGENAFLRELHRRLPCPMAGGAAAIDPVTGRSHLIPGGGEAAVLLLEDERYQFEAVTENLHTTLLERCTLTLSDPRVIDTINGCDALAWYREQRAALGLRVGGGNMIGIAGGAVAADLAVNLRAPQLCVFILFQHQGTRALADNKAAPAGVKRQ